MLDECSTEDSTAWTHTKTVYNPAGTRHCWTNDRLKKHRVDTLRQHNAAGTRQFSSVQDGIYALGKAHMRSTRSLRSSPTLPLKRFQCSSFSDDGPPSSFQGRSSSAPSLLQAIDGVMSLALCPQVVSQASQHAIAGRMID